MKGLAAVLLLLAAEVMQFSSGLVSMGSGNDQLIGVMVLFSSMARITAIYLFWLLVSEKHNEEAQHETNT